MRSRISFSMFCTFPRGEEWGGGVGGGGRERPSVFRESSSFVDLVWAE